MEIVDWTEVKDWQMTELYLSCFEHTYSKQRIRQEMEADDRVPDWGGKLYSKEGDSVTGTAGILYPKARTKNGIEEIGGVNSVCSRPSKARKGTARELLKKLHKRAKERGIQYAILHTSRGLVAHNLYRNLGYRDLHRIPMAYMKIKRGNSNVKFRNEKDPKFVKELYEKSVEGLFGLTVREDFFWEMAEARGHPKNENLRIAYEGGERIGYALFRENTKHVLCEEISAKEKGDIPKILGAIGENYPHEYIALRWTNPNYRDILEKYGFRYYDDRWERIMVKNLRGDTENALEAFNFGKDVHIGAYEYY